eukprot:CAMPEP_0114566360 /NCGR_PEP_ID=MMETSP0114-20121206/14842_1 /TAXON_ID=31324 /ORGANISM="Goniomonas sp, Strain m" /LENGTH=301 /DNA_ID=CAMNT_0001752749 /DNA_START=53 /DNA_END=958 /DNA_ORIENTATION=+
MADEENEEEQEESIVPHALTKEEVEKGLSGVAKTVDGTSYALTRFAASGLALNSISVLKTFKHIRYIDVSNNFIVDLSMLEGLPYLLSLNARKNNMMSLKLPKLEFLQVLNVSENKLKAIDGLEAPMLRYLYLTGNHIATVAGLDALEQLEKLELEKNKLKSAEGLGLPQLKTLTLANNALESVAGLDGLSGVPTLDLSGNVITTLEGFPQSPCLATLSLKGNKIDKPDQVENLKEIPLKNLDLSENPVAEVENYRIKIIRRLPALEILDEEEITEEERELAKEPEEEPPEEEPAEEEADE